MRELFRAELVICEFRRVFPAEGAEVQRAQRLYNLYGLWKGFTQEVQRCKGDRGIVNSNNTNIIPHRVTDLKQSSYVARYRSKRNSVREGLEQTPLPYFCSFRFFIFHGDVGCIQWLTVLN